jgi:glucose/arabinose dehydrogenase
MKTERKTRFLRNCILPMLAVAGGLTAAYALAQQLMGPQTKPPSAKEVEQRKAKGGYFPERMKNPNLSAHAARMTVTPPSEIPVDKIRVPKGFKVEIWAHGMPGVRMMTRGSKGTIWAGTRTIGRVYEIKDKGGSREHRILAQKLNQPNGVAFQGGALYVMAINRVFRYDGIEDNPNAKPVELTDAFKLPPDVHHNWKFIAFGPDSRLYVQVGAPCNICEPSEQHAQIRRYVADGSSMEVVARGVRNSVGFDFHPRTGELWFTDNGRDWLGEDAPPCELNVATRSGLDFGFPYCHGKDIKDPEFGQLGDCGKITPPAQLLGAHVAPLGVKFYTGNRFPEAYRGDAFIAEHGSWNRKEKNGYRITHVKIDATRGVKYEPFASGFNRGDDVFGRPVDLLVLQDGSMLVSDDTSDAIYRISYAVP